MWPREDFGGSAKGRVDGIAERKTRPFQEYECGIHEGRRRQGLRWETGLKADVGGRQGAGAGRCCKSKLRR